MRRLAAVLGVMMLLASPAMATSDFSKMWKEKFLDKEKVSKEFYDAGRKASCNLCHVKGHPDKKKARNEYGKALHKFADQKDYPKAWVKENPKEAREKFYKAVEKANAMKSKDGKKFGDKIKAEELPATDAEYKDD